MFNLATFLVEICVILAVTRATGSLFRKINQPPIIGEITAGILLGPSVLGWFSPELMTSLFPPRSLEYLNVVSQLGLLLYMFVIGVKLNAAALWERKYTAMLTSFGSIICPLALGILLAFYLHPKLTHGNIPLIPFALFLGTAMSITAFPVLARILSEQNMLHTRLGTIAIGCAAVDDITAWLLLAAITLSTHGLHQQISLSWSILGLAIYFGAMSLIVKPWLGRLRNRHPDWQFTHKMLPVFLMLLLGSALATEWLGIHALFGAFFAGYIMPKDEPLIRHLTEKIEPVTSGLFLPIFFALTGLRTSITLLNGPEMWFYFGLVLAIAVTGKLVGSLVSARLTGMSWREAGAIGVLMNTRGLIELVILNIGFDLGLIPATLFSMMVLMALVTTFMTSPLLALLYPTELFRPAPASLPQTQ